MVCRIVVMRPGLWLTWAVVVFCPPGHWSLSHTLTHTLLCTPHQSLSHLTITTSLAFHRTPFSIEQSNLNLSTDISDQYISLYSKSSHDQHIAAVFGIHWISNIQWKVMNLVLWLWKKVKMSYSMFYRMDLMRD